MCRALSNLSLQLAAQTGWVLRGCRELQDRQAAVEAAVDRQDQQAIRDRQVRAALQVLVALQGLQALLAQEEARAQLDQRVQQVLEEAQAQLARLVGPVRAAQPARHQLSPDRQAPGRVQPVTPAQQAQLQPSPVLPAGRVLRAWRPPSRVRPVLPEPQLRARQERLRQSLGLPEPPAFKEQPPQ